MAFCNRWARLASSLSSEETAEDSFSEKETAYLHRRSSASTRRALPCLSGERPRSTRCFASTLGCLTLDSRTIYACLLKRLLSYPLASLADCFPLLSLSPFVRDPRMRSLVVHAWSFLACDSSPVLPAHSATILLLPLVPRGLTLRSTGGPTTRRRRKTPSSSSPASSVGPESRSRRRLSLERRERKTCRGEEKNRGMVRIASHGNDRADFSQAGTECVYDA